MAGDGSVNGKPKVVLSFGAKDSALFAQWLYWKIRNTKSWKKNHVYLDTMALQDEADTQFCITGLRNAPGGDAVEYGRSVAGVPCGPAGPTGFDQVSGYTKGGVAAMNDNWDGYYRQAVYGCKLMIFVLSPKWFESVYCKGELQHFLNAVKAHTGPTEKKPWGLVMYFDNYPAWGTNAWAQFNSMVKKMPNGMESLHRIEPFGVNRQWSYSEANRDKIQGAQRDLYILDDRSWSRLLLKLPTKA